MYLLRTLVAFIVACATRQFLTNAKLYSLKLKATKSCVLTLNARIWFVSHVYRFVVIVIIFYFFSFLGFGFFVTTTQLQKGLDAAQNENM